MSHTFAVVKRGKFRTPSRFDLAKDAALFLRCMVIRFDAGLPDNRSLRVQFYAGLSVMAAV